MEMFTHHGSCHCKSVQFTLEYSSHITAYACNCSICEMVGFQHVIAPNNQFKLTHGEADLTTYTFNSGIAKHLFCKHCGVKSFYIPRSNPDGVSINARCLDKTHINEVVVKPFDGQNWEKNVHIVENLSKS